MIRTFAHSLLICLTCALSTSCLNNERQDEKTPVDYVNPYIGNISHLLVPTYPMTHLPNSMLRVSPERSDYTSDLIKGLPVAVTSHRGSSAFNISPMQIDGKEIKPVYSYTYDSEKVKPYRYSVYLDEVNIQVDYAPSHQSGIYLLNYEKDGDNYVVINTRNGELRVRDNIIFGYQTINNGHTKIYLYMETEQDPLSVGCLTENGRMDEQTLQVAGRNKAIIWNFGAECKQVALRYGISFISEEQAQRNLYREIPEYDLEKVASYGRNVWNETLGKIKVKDDSEENKTLFYTSLYRTYERMINISEDGQYYSAFDQSIHDDDGTPFYTDDWIWDTYRATHPLRVIIEPEMELAMVKSYIRMAQQSPRCWMPTFPEITGDSHRMNGNHAVAVIWDAYCKGLRGFDLEAAYNACKGAITEKSLLPWTKIENTELDKFYWENGFYPALKEGEPEPCKEVHHFEKRQAISVTLGNSYDNWCLSEIARELGKVDEAEYFLKASYNYRNIYNKETQFFHPKDISGEFIQPFDYRFAGGKGAREYYGENNGWIYRWDVQHNIEDLISLMGGADQFVHNLDATFREPLGTGKYAFYFQLPDHTGNVGQFSMANEPSLHIPYLYNYAGQPWKTQKRIRELLNQWFRNDLMGVPGDEDGGGMTAFVAFSMMGFYPVTPGSPSYSIGSPVFDYVKLDLGNEKHFEIIARNNSFENKYIQYATLNGMPLNKPSLDHNDIVSGGKLELTMGSKANKSWGK